MMTDATGKELRLSKMTAMAMMLMLDDAIETIRDFDPVADWEFADLYAYKLLAYQEYKRWYKETYNA